MTPERWLPVPGWEEWYEVSDHGRVRKIVAQKRGLGGYPAVTFMRDGRNAYLYVHRLVAAAFLGPAPEGHEVNHLDRNRANAHVSNLEYVTRSQNVQHALANGARMGSRGEDNPASKLTEFDVREIRRSGQTQRQLGERYGVSHSIIGRIKRGEDWKHVEDWSDYHERKAEAYRKRQGAA